MKQIVELYKSSDDSALTGDVIVTIDPQNHFKEVSSKDIINSCGFLPMWAVDSNWINAPIKEAMTVQYGFGELHEMGGEILDDGTYRSEYHEDDEEGEGDPDLVPLVHIKRKDEEMYQYQYGIVAFKQFNGETFITRMD